MLSVGVVLFAYLLGSLLFGVILSKTLRGVDIRQMDNPGGTGSIRKFGWRFGVMVGVSDALKGLAAAYVAQTVSGEPVIAILSAVAVVAGHNWPLFFGFRGGGGLAPAFGVTIYHAPWEFSLAAIPAVLLILFYKRTPLQQWLPRVGRVPIAGVLGLCTALILVSQRQGFYPAGATILAMFLPIALGGYVMLLRDKKRASL